MHSLEPLEVSQHQFTTEQIEHRRLEFEHEQKAALEEVKLQE